MLLQLHADIPLNNKHKASTQMMMQ